VKPDPHLKQDIHVELATNQKPTPPKVENNVELKNNFGLNSVYQTPINPVRGSVLNSYSVDQATTSQPKEEENKSTPRTTHANLSSEINAKRSFIMTSSYSSKDRVRFYQGTPILIEDDSPTTPAVATKEDRIASQCDASVEIQMPFDICEKQDFSTINDAEAGTSTCPNTIEKKNRKKRAAKVQSPHHPKKLKISREVDEFFSIFLRKPFFQT